MKIKQITWQHRNDFNADMICEGCKKEEKLTTGYNDDYYHRHVIPNMKCHHCGETSLTLESKKQDIKQ